jgi:hypothetical protein
MPEDIDIIFQLEPEEKVWWKKTITQYRKRIVKNPEYYVQHSLEQNAITKEQILSDPDQIIQNLRESAWARYLQDECIFHKEVISHLVISRDLPRSILSKTIENEVDGDIEADSMLETLAPIIGNFTGRVMPYIYEVSLSTTQSRRSRAGNTFEKVIENILSVITCPFDNQSSLGTRFYNDNNLGKMVDAIIPGKDHYVRNRTKCMMLTMKTTLRERWQEVVEELQRTNMPHIYLLTVDEGITSNVLGTLSSYNITVVVYDSLYESKFRNSAHNNVMGYKKLFNEEINHNLSYWNIIS